MSRYGIKFTAKAFRDHLGERDTGPFRIQLTELFTEKASDLELSIVSLPPSLRPGCDWAVEVEGDPDRCRELTRALRGFLYSESQGPKKPEEDLPAIRCPKCNAFLCRADGRLEIKCRRCGWLLRSEKKVDNVNDKGQDRPVDESAQKP
jgi:hypothetical protein